MTPAQQKIARRAGMNRWRKGERQARPLTAQNKPSKTPRPKRA